MGELFAAGAFHRSSHERDVVADVVADQHRVGADEVDEGRQHSIDCRGPHHHGLGDPGEDCDLGRDRPARVDEGLVGTEALASPQLDGPDLGDRTVLCGTAGGFDVKHDERDLMQRCTQVVEGSLLRWERGCSGRWLNFCEQMFVHGGVTMPERLFACQVFDDRRFAVTPLS